MSTYRKGLLLSLGPMQVAVDLHTVVPSSRSELRLVCPDHLAPVSQRWFCAEGEHYIDYSLLRRAAATEEGYRVVDPLDRPDEDADKVLTLNPVASSEIADNTLDGDGMYYCQPTSTAYALAWNLLVKAMENPKVTFVAKGALRRGRRKLWRLTLFRGYPVLREIVFPENIKPAPPAPAVKVDRATLNLVRQFIDTQITAWSSLDTADEYRAKLEAWINTGELVAMPDLPSEASATPGSDAVALKDILEQAVRDATKGKSR